MKKLLLSMLMLTAVFAHGQILGPILFSNGVASFNTCGAATGYAHSFTLTFAAQGSLSADVPNVDFVFLGNANFSTWSLSSGVDVTFCTTNDNAGTIIPYQFVGSTWNSSAGTAQWHVLASLISKTVSTNKIYGLVGKASATDLSCGHACTALYLNCLLVHHAGGYNGSTGSFSTQDDCGNNAGTNHGATGVTNSSNPPMSEYASFASQYFDTGLTMGTNLNSFSVIGYFGNGDFSTDHWLFGNISTAAGNPGLGVRTHTGAPCTGVSAVCFKMAIIDVAGHQSVRGANFNVGGGSAWHAWGWTHSTGTSGNAGTVIYIDGSLATTVDFGSSGTLPTDPGTSTSTWMWGKCGALCTANYTGVQDEMRVYSVAKSADFNLFFKITISNPTSVYSFSSP